MRKRNIFLNIFTVVALPSGASDRKIVWVQVPSPAPHICRLHKQSAKCTRITSPTLWGRLIFTLCKPDGFQSAEEAPLGLLFYSESLKSFRKQNRNSCRVFSFFVKKVHKKVRVYGLFSFCIFRIRLSHKFLVTSDRVVRLPVNIFI